MDAPEPAFFYELHTDQGVVFYECWSVEEAMRMAVQDQRTGILVVRCDVDSPDVNTFVAFTTAVKTGKPINLW